jgi:bifunctional non-homologous end joining protein LigD
VVVQVSNASRVVFPDVGKTKGDVVAYYTHIASRMLPHVAGRPLSMKRFPKGLAGPGFFQKNVPSHYPPSIARFAVPKHSSGVTNYPIVSEEEHLAYLANQGAIELHVTTARADGTWKPDRIVIDLDPPEGAIELVRRAAHLVRKYLDVLGVETTPIATGSKGYHVVGALAPTVDGDTIATTTHKLATLLAAAHPNELTIAFRIALRKKRVFVDWLRNNVGATHVAPYSLRARPRATVATPLAWNELDATAPDAFTIDDAQRLLDRPDPLATLGPADTRAFVSAIDVAFERSGLVLETFDRFRS